MFLTREKFTPQKEACFKIVPPLQNHRPPLGRNKRSVPKQNKFAKVNISHGKDHQKKREK